jgi:hypothetical protein
MSTAASVVALIAGVALVVVSADVFVEGLLGEHEHSSAEAPRLPQCAERLAALSRRAPASSKASASGLNIWTLACAKEQDRAWFEPGAESACYRRVA